MLVNYTDHLYDKQRHLTQALLHKNEPLRWFWTRFPRIFELSSCDLCMKVVSYMYREASIVMSVVSWAVSLQPHFSADIKKPYKRQNESISKHIALRMS